MQSQRKAAVGQDRPSRRPVGIPVSARRPADLPSEEELRDLGFGTVVSRESRRRLLNQDGTFNVERRGLGFFASITPYHSLLTMSWPRYFGLVAATYLLTNAMFAALYTLCGPGALEVAGSRSASLADAFFFSVQTLATIGYGRIYPVGTAANVLVTLESLVGLLGFALVTGLLFARFSRPMADILFSRDAVIAPYRGISSFQFRIANRRSSQIIELQAQLLFSRLEERDGMHVRRFYDLSLERRKVVFFPLSWTIVHPIDDSSPLNGFSPEDLRETGAEFLILLTGIDETFSQMVHARSSYKADEIVWNARFADVFQRPQDGGPLAIDIGRLHAIERLSTTEAS